jgi:opacity protein-like surface antigen
MGANQSIRQFHKKGCLAKQAADQARMNYHFAWAAMAGVAIAMTDHAQLDVGYRFLDLGPITGISPVTGTSVTQRIRVNEVRAGVRYMID